jgi:hypothetical protein
MGGNKANGDGGGACRNNGTMEWWNDASGILRAADPTRYSIVPAFPYSRVPGFSIAQVSWYSYAFTGQRVHAGDGLWRTKPNQKGVSSLGGSGDTILINRRLGMSLILPRVVLTIRPGADKMVIYGCDCATGWRRWPTAGDHPVLLEGLLPARRRLRGILHRQRPPGAHQRHHGLAGPVLYDHRLRHAHAQMAIHQERLWQ